MNHGGELLVLHCGNEGSMESTCDRIRLLRDKVNLQSFPAITFNNQNKLFYGSLYTLCSRITMEIKIITTEYSQPLLSSLLEPNKLLEPLGSYAHLGFTRLHSLIITCWLLPFLLHAAHFFWKLSWFFFIASLLNPASHLLLHLLWVKCNWAFQLGWANTINQVLFLVLMDIEVVLFQD